MKLMAAYLRAGLVLSCFWSIAHATQLPAGGRLDSRIRYVAYSPDQVVHLSTNVGGTLVVTFSATETVMSVAETDSNHLAASPEANFLFFKPSASLSLQPVIVLTRQTNGSIRRYVFEIETVATKNMGDKAPGIYFSVQFLYPQDDTAAAVEAAAATAKLNQKEAEKAKQKMNEATVAAAFEEDKEAPRDPLAGPRNYKYNGRGDTSLIPSSIWDNGYSTVMQFSSNTRIPSIFVENPDGNEAIANYSVSGNTVQISQTAKEFVLRDGKMVLDIFNLAYSPVGTNPGTGTTSPDVLRVVVPAKPKDTP